MKVAFIGIGNMGKPMAANVARGGHEVLLFDSNPQTASRAAQEIGATWLENLAGAAAAELVVTMLPDGKVVRQVLVGGGALAESLRPGSIVVDMSSSQPMITLETGAALAKGGVSLIDAPVSGGVVRAVSGTLTIMVGTDDPTALAKAKPILSCMGKTIFEVGKLGSGHTAKALNNVVAAGNQAVLVDALLVADQYGIDREKLIDIISVSTGQSFMSTVVMKQHVVPQTYNTGFTVGLLAKDTNIAAELSAQLGVRVPHIELTNQRWAQARDDMGPGEDNSRAIIAWQKRSKL